MKLASQIRTLISGNGTISLYVILLVVVSVFPQGFQSLHFGATLTDTPLVMSEKFGYADAGSYLKGALELSELGGLTADKHWIINLWPPGMVWLNAALIAVVGSKYGVVYAICVASIWALLLSIFAVKVSKIFGKLMAYVSVSLVAALSPLQNWIFDYGIFYAEGFSTAFFLAGLITLIRGGSAIETSRLLAFGISSGTFFAIAAYFRATYSTLEPVLLLSTIVGVILLLFPNLLRRLQIRRAEIKAQVLLIGSSWLAMFLLMEPWLQFTRIAIRGMRAWSVVSSGFFRGAWVPREEQAGFLREGGVGWACELDPIFCKVVSSYEEANGPSSYPIGEIFFKTIGTILAHPLEYAADRFDFISTGWFSIESAMGSPSILSGLIFLTGFGAFVVTCFKMLFRGNLVMLTIIGFICLILAPAFVGHIEPRYFIALKLLVITMPWLFELETKTSKVSTKSTP